MTTAPRSESHDRAVQATIRSWRDKGGDPDIVGRLPQLLVASGFCIESVVPHNRVARGGDAMFVWPQLWWHTFAPKLVGMGLLSAYDCEQVFADLRAIKQGTTGFVQCPVVYEVIARKR